MKYTLRWFCLLFILLLAACAVKRPAEPIKREKREPDIRVGIVWGKEVVEFSIMRSSQITSHDGTFISRGIDGGRWRAEVKTSVPAFFVYRLATPSYNNIREAEERMKDIERMGHEAGLETSGKAIRIGERQVHDNRRYRVLLQKTFVNEEWAEQYRDAIWNRLETTVVRQKVRGARGTILLKNLENGRQFESSKPILVRRSAVTLYDVPVGVGFHWETRETRTYPETICFQLDNEGKLAVINILPLENYLRGVVPSEMPNGFPSEALKAQAVAARSEVLSKLHLSHRDDPFHVCSDVHCQVYSGLSKWASSTDRAIKRTRGLVLSKNRKILNAVYSSVCGGHGEGNDKAWGGQSLSYLKGRFDGTGRLKRYGPLSNEGKVINWIDSSPPAYCNTMRGRLPASLEYTKKYFRWEVRYAQEELRSIIHKKTGQNVGSILNLMPLERGDSGRIIRLKVRGTRNEFIIDGELNIRKALSNNTLWSSCFYVRNEGWMNGAPRELVLKGAGFGHGVGMCQTGAAMMALQGKRFYHVLQHYFKGVNIRRLY